MSLRTLSISLFDIEGQMLEIITVFSELVIFRSCIS